MACHSPGMEMANNVLVGAEGESVRGSWPGRGNAISQNIRSLKTAVEGKSVGADRGALEIAQGRVKLLGAAEVTATSAEIRFVAPDGQSCPVDFGSDDGKLVDRFSRVADSGQERARSVRLNALKPQTRYRFRVNCAVEQPTGTFETK